MNTQIVEDRVDSLVMSFVSDLETELNGLGENPNYEQVRQLIRESLTRLENE